MFSEIRVENFKKNTQHLDFPEPGDYWQEMCCAYFIVVAVRENGVVICQHTKVLGRGFRFDLERCELADRDWMERNVKYSSGDGFVADVWPSAERGLSLAEAWENLGSPCRPVAPLPKVLAPHQKRVVEEKAELDKKIQALSDFIYKNEAFHKVDVEEQRRLVEQLTVMSNYSGILGERIAAF